MRKISDDEKVRIKKYQFYDYPKKIIIIK